MGDFTRLHALEEQIMLLTLANHHKVLLSELPTFVIVVLVILTFHKRLSMLLLTLELAKFVFDMTQHKYTPVVERMKMIGVWKQG